MTIKRAAAFIAADAADDSLGFATLPETAIVLRHQSGAFNITASGENGKARYWSDYRGDPLQSGYRNHHYAKTRLGLGVESGNAAY